MLIKVEILIVTAQTPDQTNKTNSYIRWNLSISNRLLLLLNERGRLERGRQALAQLYTVWYPQRPWLINVEIIIVTAQTPDQTNNMWLSFISWNLSIYNRLLLLNERGKQERGRQAHAQLYTVWYPQWPWLIHVEIIIVTAQIPDQTNKTNNIWLSFISWNLSIYNRLLLLNERGRQERGRQARAQLSTVWYPQRPRLIKVEIIIVMKISGCYGTFLNGLSF